METWDYDAEKDTEGWEEDAAAMREARKATCPAARIIELARQKGISPTADMVADALVPDRLPEDDPAYLTDDDPWSVVWDEADILLHAESRS